MLILSGRIRLQKFDKRDRYPKKALDHFNAAIGIDNSSAHNGRANIFYLREDVILSGCKYCYTLLLLFLQNPNADIRHSQKISS